MGDEPHLATMFEISSSTVGALLMLRVGFFIGAIALVSVLLAVFGATRDVALCIVGEGQERYEKTAEFLNGVLDLSLTLSTSLVSLGAALLLGFHSNIRLTPISAALLLLALVGLAQSAAYGIWWKLQLADLWFNECFNQIGSPHFQWFYQAHFLFLVTGIFFVALLVGFLSWGRISNNPEGEEDG
jgi:hypothetical protein